MIPLTKDPVSARQTERKAQELLNEFLKDFFTGAPHASLLGAVTFPLCDFFFNQATLPAPADKPQIHIVFTDIKTTARWKDDTTKEVTADCLFTVFFRVANQGAAGNKSEFLCRSVADNFKELFQSDDRYALSRKGIHHARITRGPVALQATGYQARMAVLTCLLKYDVPRALPLGVA